MKRAAAATARLFDDVKPRAKAQSTAPLYALDIAGCPLGQLVGGKYGQSVECPVCARPAVLYRKSRERGAFFTEYAHRICLDLDPHNEAVMRASEICRLWDDPSLRAAKGAK